MSYFDRFPSSLYTFADGRQGIMQNISLYSEILDDVKKNGAFYKDYYIQNGDRPDNVAFTLYQNPALHWTLYLMNDHLREQGWPLDHTEIVKKAKIDLPNVTLTTDDTIAGIFSVGDSVEGNDSEATGTIVSRNLDLGQLIIETTNNKTFGSDELLNLVGSAEQITITASEPQYLSARYYLQDGEIITNRLDLAGPETYIEVTNLDFYKQENDKLRQIIVLKPSSVNRVVQLFKQAINS